MHDGKDHIDAAWLSAFTQADQRTAATRISGIWPQDNGRRVFEDGQRFFSFQERNVVEMPATLLVDRNRDDFKAVAVQMIDDGSSRLK